MEVADDLEKAKKNRQSPAGSSMSFKLEPFSLREHAGRAQGCARL
jgi:hypothetical protein